MSDDWNFYFCNIDDNCASILVNLGIAGSIPNVDLPLMGCVRLQMNSPYENGMTSRDEYNILNEIEETLERELIHNGSKYVGRCTSNSCQEFFFYHSPTPEWFNYVDNAMSSFPDYRYVVNIREDIDGSIYHSFLYPSQTDFQSINNRKVCKILDDNGDRMDEQREIQHWIYFNNESICHAFVAEIIQRNFTIKYRCEPNSAEDRDRYSVCISRMDIPSFENIDNVTLPLFHLAIEHDGKYDGWECAIVR